MSLRSLIFCLHSLSQRRPFEKVFFLFFFFFLMANFIVEKKVLWQKRKSFEGKKSLNYSYGSCLLCIDSQECLSLRLSVDASKQKLVITKLLIQVSKIYFYKRAKSFIFTFFFHFVLPEGVKNHASIRCWKEFVFRGCEYECKSSMQNCKLEILSIYIQLQFKLACNMSTCIQFLQILLNASEHVDLHACAHPKFQLL